MSGLFSEFWNTPDPGGVELVWQLKAAVGVVTEKRRTAKQRRTVIMVVAQAAADLAKKAEASTNNLVKVY
jgi:hypothetical protein